MNTRILLAALLLLIGDAADTLAQGCGNLNLQEVSDISGTCTKLMLSLHPDNTGRPNAYIAEKEGGLRIVALDNGIPTFAVELGPENFDSLDVMNISQQGTYLYLALGNHFGTASQSPGMAIVDVAQPMSPKVTALYKYPATNGGCGIVKAEGNYAYMGAMLHGLVILDISDKDTIKYVSELMPDRNFPAAKPDTLKYNARGMAVRNSIVYLCFDAGGFRTIDCTDKAHPHEIGQYSAPEVIARPRAYNNVAIDDTLAYVAIDYCGMEILSIADPAHITRVGWWNPWHCEGPANNWFNSGGYANEIELLPSCKLAFISAGRTPLEVVDVSDPEHPDSCTAYPGPINVGSWGVSVGADHIYVSYICALIPFVSGSTGIKVLSFTPCDAAVSKRISAKSISLVPQPVGNSLRVNISDAFENAADVVVEVFDLLGNRQNVDVSVATASELRLDVHSLSEGTYFMRLANDRFKLTKSFVKCK